MERVHDVAAQIFARPRCAEPFAFEAEERDFVEWIHHSQARIEFQAVDDGDRITETDVLGAQVAVAIDDAPRPHAFGQILGALGQEPALHGVDVVDRPRGKPITCIEQDATVVGKVAPEVKITP
jgi:hypothetical protein